MLTWTFRKRLLDLVSRLLWVGKLSWRAREERCWCRIGWISVRRTRWTSLSSSQAWRGLAADQSWRRRTRVLGPAGISMEIVPSPNIESGRLSQQLRVAAPSAGPGRTGDQRRESHHSRSLGRGEGTGAAAPPCSRSGKNGSP